MYINMHCLKIKATLKHQILIKKLFKLNIFTNVYCIICSQQNHIITLNGNQNVSTHGRLYSKPH